MVPPSFNVSKIEAPVALIYGMNDKIVNIKVNKN